MMSGRVSRLALRARRPHRAGGPRPRACVTGAWLEDPAGPSAVHPVPRRRGRRFRRRPGLGSRMPRDRRIGNRRPRRRRRTRRVGRSWLIVARGWRLPRHRVSIRAGWSVRERPSSARGRPFSAARDVADAAEPPSNGPPGPGDADDETPQRPWRSEPVDSGSRRVVGRDAFAAHAIRPGRCRDVLDPAGRARARRAAPASDEDLAAYDRPSRSSAAAPRPIPEDALSSVAKRPRVADESDAADDTESPEPAEATAPRARSNRRPTWRELSISPDEVPVDEALRRSSGDEDEAEDREAVQRAGGPASRDGSGDAPATVDERAEIPPRRRPAAAVASVPTAEGTPDAPSPPVRRLADREGEAGILLAGSEVRRPGLPASIPAIVASSSSSCPASTARWCRSATSTPTSSSSTSGGAGACSAGSRSSTTARSRSRSAAGASR